MTITAVDPVPQEVRRRRTIVLALVHAVLAALILAGFVFVQMHRG